MSVAIRWAKNEFWCELGWFLHGQSHIVWLLNCLNTQNYNTCTACMYIYVLQFLKRSTNTHIIWYEQLDKIYMHTMSCKRFSNFDISCLTFIITESSALVLCMPAALSLYSPFSSADNDLHLVAEKQFFSCRVVQLKDSKIIQYSYTMYIWQPAERMHSAWYKLYPDTPLIFLGSLT